MFYMYALKVSHYTVTLLLFAETNLSYCCWWNTWVWGAVVDKRLSVYLKNGGKADTCSIFATVCPNHFEMCPITVVYGWNNLNLVECSRILAEISRASRLRCYTYRKVSRVFRIPFRGGVVPEKGILNMSDIILYVFCIMAPNQLCLFWVQRSSYQVVNEEWYIFVIIFTNVFLFLTWRSCNTWQL